MDGLPGQCICYVTNLLDFTQSTKHRINLKCHVAIESLERALVNTQGVPYKLSLSVSRSVNFVNGCVWVIKNVSPKGISQVVNLQSRPFAVGCRLHRRMLVLPHALSFEPPLFKAYPSDRSVGNVQPRSHQLIDIPHVVNPFGCIYRLQSLSPRLLLLLISLLHLHLI